MRGLQIVRQVFEHGRLAINAIAKFEEAPERLRLGLRHIAAGRDIVNPVELIQHAQLFRHPLGMARRAVGEDEFAALKPLDGFGKLRRVLNRRQVYIVHVGQEPLGLDAMLGHQPGKRGPVLVIKLLLHLEGGRRIEPEQLLNVSGHAPVDLGEQIALGGIERVVEIEDPKPRVPESLGDAARAWRSVSHQSRSISVPTPCSVNSSSSTACGTRPSRITTPSTPFSITLMHPSTFGIMPPVMVPSAIMALA